MKLITQILLTLLFSSTILLASTKPILKLDTLGHTGLIGDIITTDDGEIISASDDKTIRIWDSKTGMEKRKILGQIDSGFGEIYAIALSKDKKYLAVGGFLDQPGHGESGQIRIYNYYSGKLIKILKSHTNVVLDLFFNNNYLISGSSDYTVKVWNIKDNFKLIDTIKAHKNAVNAVGAFKNKYKTYIISAGYDNKAYLYDLEKKKIANSFEANFNLDSIAINNIEKQIAISGFDKKIFIFDFKLNLLKIIYNDTGTAGLNYSKNGKYLIVGAGKYPYNVNIYTVLDFRLHSSLKKHTNLTMAVNFLDNFTAVSGGGNINEIYIWDINRTKIQQRIVGAGRKIFSIGINEDNIAWGNKYDKKYKKNLGPLQKSINLKSFNIKYLTSNIINFHSIYTTNGTWSLSHSKGGNYGYYNAVLNIKHNGKTIKKIIKDATNGYGHNCYGWYKDYIISGGSNGQLKIYNKEGMEIASLIGHTGEIWSIALEGNRLVSGSSDQTIRVWNLSQITNISPNKYLITNVYNNSPAQKYGLKEGDIILSIDEKKFKNIQTAKKYLKSKKICIFTINRNNKSFKIKVKRNNNKFGFKSIILLQEIYPTLNIFVSKDDDYVVWTNSGYFASSPKGAKYIGYHINQGSNKEARFVSVDKYFDKYYRPDIIKYAWETGSEKMAIKFASKNKKIQSVDISNSLPPVITLLSSDNIKTTNKTITIKYQIDSDTPIKELEVAVNGEKINKRALKKKKNKNYKTITINLQNGQNIITLRAKNKYAWSDNIYIKTYYEGQKKLYRPTLYILSIGVSKYKNPEFNLNVADKDASSFTNLFKSFEGKVYKKVINKTLTNNKASKDNILDALDWITDEATQKDVVMIFVAGHGLNDDKGSYYFLPYNANLDRLRRTAVRWIEFEDTISNIPGKVLLFADTCHSGNITGGSRRDITSAVKSIIDSSNGAIIFTATTGSGYSYEYKKLGHGAFTKAIIDGIGYFKADYNKDNTVGVKELDLFITNEVKRLTNGKQKPTTIIPRSIPDFAIGAR